MEAEGDTKAPPANGLKGGNISSVGDPRGEWVPTEIRSRVMPPTPRTGRSGRVAGDLAAVGPTPAPPGRGLVKATSELLMLRLRVNRVGFLMPMCWTQ